MTVHELADVDVVALSIVTKAANRKRFFLRKAKAAANGDLLDLPNPGKIAKAQDWSAVYCVVAEPGSLEDPGLHGDGATPDRWASEDEIRKTAHRFMKNGGLVNMMHNSFESHGQLVENAIALADFEVDGQVIKKGSWYVAFEPNAEAKAEIEAGTFGGVSIQGTGFRTPVAKRRPFEERLHPRKGGKFAPKGTTDVGAIAGQPKGQAKPKAQVTEEQRRSRTVRTAANLLQAAGYSGNMSQAIRDFQTKHKLDPTGELDPETMTALRESHRKPKVEGEVAPVEPKPKVSRREKQRRKRSGKPRAKGAVAKRSLARSPKKNWIERLPKGLQTAWEHSWAHRAAVHLVDKGMSVGHAIAVGTNAADKLCATGDVNWPGKQDVNPGSRAEACASVALWASMKAAAHAGGASIAKSGEETEESVEAVFEALAKLADDAAPLAR